MSNPIAIRRSNRHCGPFHFAESPSRRSANHRPAAADRGAARSAIGRLLLVVSAAAAASIRRSTVLGLASAIGVSISSVQRRIGSWRRGDLEAGQRADPRQPAGNREQAGLSPRGETQYELP